MAALIALALAAAAPAAFDPLAFFTGKSEGRGTIKIVLKPAQPLRVETIGRPDGKGGITLDQVVHQGGEPAKTRRWALRPTSPTTVAGTLSDAVGPVSGTLSGMVLKLSYRMPGSLTAHQTLTAQPGGQTLLNRMTIKKFGLTVARIEEVITRN